MPNYSTNCEGRCCCRCSKCSGHGYYKSYKITFPQPTLTAGDPGCTSWQLCFPKSIYVALRQMFVAGECTTSIYPFGPVCDNLCLGLYGANPDYPAFGCCEWNSVFSPNLAMYEDASQRILCTTGAPPSPRRVDAIVVRYDQDTIRLNVFYYVDSIAYRSYEFIFTRDGERNCAVPSTFSLTSSTGNDPGCYIDFSGLTVTVEQAEDPDGYPQEWFQCGQNPDGTDYVEENQSFMARMPSAVRALLGPVLTGKPATAKPMQLPIVRPTRCEHIGKRSENRAGCGGWTCGHKCDLGLPAVPGRYCQYVCDKYEADVDFESRGEAGWLA